MEPIRCSQALLGVILLLGSAAGQAAHEDARLVASVPQYYAYFGTSVAVSGNRALVGSPGDDGLVDGSGCAYIFERSVDGAWVETAKLAAADGTGSDDFGDSVSLWGDRAVVGAPNDGPGCPSCGAVYVFERQGDGSWLQTAKLRPDEPGYHTDFGRQLSLSGERVLVGDWGTVPFVPAAAYVFDRQGDGSWVQSAKLTSAPEDKFGIAVSLWGDRALVTAAGDDGSHSVYVFERGADGAWVKATQLVPSGAGGGGLFGIGVSLENDRALIGELGDSDILGSGSAHVFERSGSGEWLQVAELKASDPTDSDQFGASVSLAGSRAVVGAWLHSDAFFGQGAVYDFHREEDGSWPLVAKLTASDGELSNRFGERVHATEDRVITGTRMVDSYSAISSGAAYIIDLGTLYHGPPTLSVATGGTQELLLRAGPDMAGGMFVILGSISGTSPGFVDPLSGLILPLHPDRYFSRMLATQGGPYVSPGVGQLDGSGAANAVFSIPPAGPIFVGLVLHHAYAVVDPHSQGAFLLASNPARVELIP
jgi:hypothetical protein